MKAQEGVNELARWTDSLYEYTVHGMPSYPVKDDEGVWTSFGGHLCGYIKLPEDHPMNGVDYFRNMGGEEWSRPYDAAPVDVTFSERDENGDWWIGFGYFEQCHRGQRTRYNLAKAKSDLEQLVIWLDLVAIKHYLCSE